MFIQSFGDDALVDSPDNLFFHLAVFENEQGWNAANIETRAGREVRIDIEFPHLHAAFVFFSNRIDRWSYCAARCTPGGPKIYKNRCVRFHNFRFEVGIRDLYRISAHESSEKNSTLIRQSQAPTPLPFSRWSCIRTLKESYLSCAADSASGSVHDRYATCVPRPGRCYRSVGSP